MNRDADEIRNRLRGVGPRIHPSLLNCDFAVLGDEIDEAARCGAGGVHWDVMDGHFVANLTYGAPVIRSLRPRSTLLFDTHLMIDRPENYLDGFLEAGCDIVTIHLEAVADPSDALATIRGAGRLAGLAINPPTPVESLTPWLDRVDLVLIMSVMPGFGGQAFDPGALAKLQWVRRHAMPGTRIEVDGGVNRSTIAAAEEAGADVFVTGSAFYGAESRKDAYDELVRAIDRP